MLVDDLESARIAHMLGHLVVAIRVVPHRRTYRLDIGGKALDASGCHDAVEQRFLAQLLEHLGMEALELRELSAVLVHAHVEVARGAVEQVFGQVAIIERPHVVSL